jgi:hypothetical protein
MAKKENKTGKHGGARPGAGRPSSGYATATVSIRHRKDVIDRVKEKYKNPGELTRLGQQWLDSLAEHSQDIL